MSSLNLGPEVRNLCLKDGRKGESEYLVLKLGVYSFAGVYAEETRFLYLDFGSMYT